MMSLRGEVEPMGISETDRSALTDDTQLSPGLRPDVLRDPEFQQQRAAIEAALFGGVAEAVSVGRFRLLQRLGEGGMGTVYAAFDDRLDRKIAVKLIRPSRLESADVRERTLREARALARLSHPNVVHVYEVGEIGDQLFVAMEFLAGPTLRDWLDAEPRPWREVLQIYCQAGEGLVAAHAQGIIHRDFKPHNAMLGADGRVRVLDFGLARIGEFEMAQADGHAQLTDGALTMTGALLGTPAYMAPEHLKARQVSVLSDQFSFCVALFEALYGHRPFAGETIIHLRTNLTAGRITARPRDTDVPRWVHAVLLRGLSVESADRWPSMRELITALERDPDLRRRRVVAGTALVAFAGALGFALIQPFIQPSDPPVEAEVCAGVRDQITEVWGETRSASVQELVHSRHGANADEILAIAVPQLHRYANEWSDMRDEACRIHAEGQQSDNVFDLRTACLDQRLAGLDALVQILADADAEQLANITKGASELPAIERCADTTALLAAIAPPEDAGIRARVEQHRETLARAKVHADVGQSKLGLELVTKVLADAETLTYEPLLAESYLRKGYIESRMDPAEAERSLSRALWTALAIGHAAVAAEASSKRGILYGMMLGQHQRAKDDLPMIMALNRRVEDDISIYTEYLGDIGQVYLNTGDWREARQWFEEAHDLRSARMPRVDWKGLAIQSNLGHVAIQDKRFADAVEIFTEVIHDAEALLGPSHVSHLVFSMSLTLALQMAGRPHAALAEIQKCLGKIDSVESGFERARILAVAAWIERERRDFDVSREYLNDALASTSADVGVTGTILNQLMFLAADEGDKPAVHEYQRQRVMYVERHPAADPGVRFALSCDYGRALYTVGATQEAIAELERVRPMLDDAGISSTVSATWRWELALALGKAYRAFGDLDAADRELHLALVELRALHSTDAPPHAEALYELGELELARQRWKQASAHFAEAETIYATTAEADYLPRVRIRFAQAQALTGGAKLASPEARELAEAAVQGLRANAKDEDADVVESWLAEH
jgi:tRNA A-37 threonylcarbamoyl transferase component Bud32/tetratricopeptide (TPR) repeat protein